MTENRISRHSSVCISAPTDSGDLNNALNEGLLSNNMNNRPTGNPQSFVVGPQFRGAEAHRYAFDSDTDDDYEPNQTDMSQRDYSHVNSQAYMQAHEASQVDSRIEIWRREERRGCDGISIPEFALDSSFFDFLYAMYENEEPSRSSVRGQHADQRYTLVYEYEYLLGQESTGDEANPITGNVAAEEDNLLEKIEEDSSTDGEDTELMALQGSANVETDHCNHDSHSQANANIAQRQYSAIHDLMSIISNYERRKRLLDRTEIQHGRKIDSRLMQGFNRKKNELMDSQGLIWENRQQRLRVTKSRMHTFGSYTHVYNSVASAMADVDYYLTPRESNNYILAYKGFYTKPDLKLVHFQLRNVMTSFNEQFVFYASSDVTDDSAYMSKLDVTTGQVSPVWNNSDDPWNLFKISTLASKQNSYLVAGSFDGSIITYIPERDQTSSFQISQGRNCIINYICVPKGQDNATDLTIASNDKKVCLFDLQAWKKTRDMKFSYPMNCVAQNPNNANELLLAGDSTEALVIDKRQSDEEQVLRLKNHKDYSFACDWSSDHLLATGNQDSTVRIYDDRNTSKPLHTLSGYYHGAVRNMKFSGSGDCRCKYLAFAESIDNAYVVDLASGTASENGTPRYQHLGFFGKVAGLDFNLTEGGFNEDLTVAVADGCLGGIYRYRLDGFNYEGGMSDMTWI